MTQDFPTGHQHLRSYFNRSLIYLVFLYLSANAVYLFAKQQWVELGMFHDQHRTSFFNAYSLTIFLFYLALIPGAIWADKTRQSKSVIAAGLLIMLAGTLGGWLRPEQAVAYAIHISAIGYGIFLAGFVTAVAHEIKNASLHTAKFFWLWILITGLFHLLFFEFIKQFLYGRSLIYFKIAATLSILLAWLIMVLWRPSSRARDNTLAFRSWPLALWAVVGWGLILGLDSFLQQHFASVIASKKVLHFFWQTSFLENISMECLAALVSWFFLFKISLSLRTKIMVGLSIFILYVVAMLIPLATGHATYLLLEWMYSLSIYILLPLFYLIILQHTPPGFYGRVLVAKYLVIEELISLFGLFFSFQHLSIQKYSINFMDIFYLAFMVIILGYLLYLAIALQRQAREEKM